MFEGPGSDATRDGRGTLAELLESAEGFERRAGSSTDVEEWRRAESESLLQWASERGKILSDAQYGDLLGGFVNLASGLEHRVWYSRNQGRAFKITIPPHFGQYADLRIYVQNVIWCNSVFGDYMQLEGVYHGSEGVSLVMSQPFIIGRKPSDDEIAAWFISQGCRELSKYRWIYPNGTIVADAHTGNLVMMKATNGDDEECLIPIDLHVQKMHHPI